MAIRFDAAADRLLRTSDLPDYTSPYTWMCWFYLASDLNATSTILSLSRDTGNVDDLRTATDGVTLAIRSRTSGAGGNVNGSTISIGTWYHVAMVRASATSLLMYLNGVQDAEATTSAAGRDVATRMELGAQFATDSNRMDGSVAAKKCWLTNLSQAEVVNEMYTFLPRRLANLYGWWPGLPGSGERIKDYSGNGRDWSEAGTLADEAHPPISWGASNLFQAPFSPMVATGNPWYYYAQL